MPKTQSKSFPTIQRLQGLVRVPYNVSAVEVAMEGEESTETFFNYDLYRHAPSVDVDNLDYWKSVVWKLLQKDLHEHVYGVYDQGEQASILAYAARASNEDRQDIVAECLPVQEWIDSVLAYYDARKDSIFAATDQAALLSVTWDFPNDMPCTDRKDWRVIKSMFAV